MLFAFKLHRMKTLYLMRHAKSDWKVEATDLNRPLNDRGRMNAPLMGKLLKSKNELPELIISSPAFRADATAVMLADAVGYQGEVLTKDDFYFGDLEDVLEVLYSLSARLHSALIVGHNPVWHDIAKHFVGFSEEKFPTAAILKIRFATNNWRDIAPENASTDWFVKPRALINPDL